MVSREEVRFARRVSLKVLPGKLEEFRKAYRKLLPSLAKEPGVRRVYLLSSVDNPSEVISLTLWNSESQAEKYAEKSFKVYLNKVAHLTAGEASVVKLRVLEHKVGTSLTARKKKAGA